MVPLRRLPPGVIAPVELFIIPKPRGRWVKISGQKLLKFHRSSEPPEGAGKLAPFLKAAEALKNGNENLLCPLGVSD